MDANYFMQLNAINVNDKTEKKGGLTYLSWAYAWGELKKLYPDATYAVYENAEGWNYFTDGRTAWVKTGVTVNGIEHIEYLPVMDSRNKSIPLGNITSFDVNKAVQRSLTKAVARHGLGLYIYAGEDLPEDADGSDGAPQKKQGRLFTEDEAAAAKKWADAFGLTAYEDACGQMGVADLTECEYVRRSDFMAIVRERARASKGEDN